MKPLVSVKPEYFTSLDSFCMLFVGIWMSSSRWILTGYGLAAESGDATMGNVLFIFTITMGIMFALSLAVAPLRHRSQSIRYRKLNGEAVETMIMRRLRAITPLWIFGMLILLVFIVLPLSVLMLSLIASHYSAVGANPAHHLLAKGIIVGFWLLISFITPLFGLYDGRFYY